MNELYYFFFNSLEEKIFKAFQRYNFTFPISF